MNSRKFLKKALSIAVVAMSLVTANAHAVYIEPGTNQIVADGGEVFIRFESRSAAHSTNVVLERDNSVIFNNQTAIAGEVFSLGSFAAGEIVSFRFDNLTSGVSYFSGLGSFNIDNFEHAKLTAIESLGTIKLSFEDLMNGGDRDFDDLVATVFTSADAVMPLPGSAWLLISGFAGLVFASSRRKRAAVSR